MDKKTKAYVDTSAFIAFLDASDSYHPLFLQLFSAPPKLVTTSLVIAEGHGWFLRRYDTQKAIQFLNFVESVLSLRIESLGGKEIESAKLIIKKFSDQKLTLADAVGLHVMKKEKIISCWSTDRHLGLCGAELVIHS